MGLYIVKEMIETKEIEKMLRREKFRHRFVMLAAWTYTQTLNPSWHPIVLCLSPSSSPDLDEAQPKSSAPLCHMRHAVLLPPCATFSALHRRRCELPFVLRVSRRIKIRLYNVISRYPHSSNFRSSAHPLHFITSSHRMLDCTLTIACKPQHRIRI